MILFSSEGLLALRSAFSSKGSISRSGLSIFKIELLRSLSASLTYSGKIFKEQWTLAKASESLIIDSSCLIVIL